MLAATGVLKLIDQQVADAVRHDERSIGGLKGRLSALSTRWGDLRVLQCSRLKHAFGEHDN